MATPAIIFQCQTAIFPSPFQPKGAVRPLLPAALLVLDNFDLQNHDKFCPKKIPQNVRSLVDPRMSNCNLNTISGFLLDLKQLGRLLVSISTANRTWSCLNVSEQSHWIAIRYSNPVYGGTLPNDIIYRFPLIRSPIWCFPATETTYVCLSLGVAEEVQGGLYFENDEVKRDFLEDLNTFWEPLHTELQRRVCLSYRRIGSPEGQEATG